MQLSPLVNEVVRTEKTRLMIGPAREGVQLLQLFIFYNQRIADRKKRMALSWSVAEEVEFHHHLRIREMLLSELLNSFAWSIANAEIP